MSSKTLQDALKHTELWPTEAQDELAMIVLEMNAAMKGGVYRATPDELAGIDRGLEDALAGRFAAAAEIAAVFAKHRSA